MARCGCSDSNICSCVIRGGGAVDVTGTGTFTNPYVVSVGSGIVVTDTGTIDLSLSGEGSVTEPWNLTANFVGSMEDIADVDLSNTTTGHVLALQADGTYDLVPPATASPGAINSAQAIQGDGSAGLPLDVRLAPDSGLTKTAAGLAVTGAVEAVPYTPQLHRSTGGTVTIGSGSTLVGDYVQIGKMVHFSVELNVGAGFVIGSSFFMLTLPVTPKIGRVQAVDCGAVFPEFSGQSVEREGWGKIEGVDDYVTRTYFDVSGSTRRLGAVFPQWLPGTKMWWSGTYLAE
jgi:hypothetical protein